MFDTNPIDAALEKLDFSCDRGLVEMAFRDNRRYGSSDNRSIEERIRSKIINNVIRDCNDLGGDRVQLELTDVPALRDGYTTVFNFTEDQLMGRRILRVYRVEYLDIMEGSYSKDGAMTLGELSMQSIRRVEHQGSFEANRHVRVDNNGHTVYVEREHEMHYRRRFLVCDVTFDENMTTLPRELYEIFANMVEHKLKSFIYTQLRSNVNDGNLNGGSFNGVFRELISNYSSSDKEYEDLKAVFASNLSASDDDRLEEYVLMQRGFFR